MPNACESYDEFDGGADAVPLKPVKNPEFEYRQAATMLMGAKPVARFWVATPFDIVDNGLAVALVRPLAGDPQEVEVIDCLNLDTPALRRAVIKLAKLRQQLVRLAGLR